MPHRSAGHRIHRVGVFLPVLHIELAVVSARHQTAVADRHHILFQRSGHIVAVFRLVDPDAPRAALLALALADNLAAQLHYVVAAAVALQNAGHQVAAVALGDSVEIEPAALVGLDQESPFRRIFEAEEVHADVFLHSGRHQRLLLSSSSAVRKAEAPQVEQRPGRRVEGPAALAPDVAGNIENVDEHAVESYPLTGVDARKNGAFVIARDGIVDHQQHAVQRILHVLPKH